MLIVGRITKDAVVAELKDNRQVVNFTIAVNDRYKPKGGEPKQFTLFINCSYWISTKIVSLLSKGTLIEAEGRFFLNAYNDMKGEPRASLNCHVNTIKIHSSSKRTEGNEEKPAPAVEKSNSDDLPF